MTKFLFCGFALLLNCSPALMAADESAPATAIDGRYVGVWEGAWLEGMSSGKVKLEITESGGQLSFTSLPNFGVTPASVRKLTGNEKRLGFETAGADGRTIRFELKPSSDNKQLKGKAYYDGLHMELDLAKTP